MASYGEATRDRLGSALESYLAAIRLTQDQATLGELEVQLESDERLRSSDREFLRTLLEARTRGPR